MSIKKTYSTLAHYLSVTIYSIKMALLTIVEYPSNILGWLLSNPIQFLLGFAAIRFAVEQFGEINGWNYGQLAFLYGISVISHALSMIFFVQGWFMGFYVIEGEFDRFLTRPMSVLYQFFFRIKSLRFIVQRSNQFLFFCNLTTVGNYFSLYRFHMFILACLNAAYKKLFSQN